MEPNFAIGGFVAAMVIIGVFGVWLRQISGRAREALVPHVGEQPAFWLYWLAWAGYVIGALQALASAINVAPDTFYGPSVPSAVQFLFGVISGPLVTFTNVAISFLQIGALVAAVLVVSRVLRAENP